MITLVILREIEPDEEENGKDDSAEMERCVICGAETNIPRNLHIAFRDCYIPGVGQLCRKCWLKI